jgi:hypothetical protein
MFYRAWAQPGALFSPTFPNRVVSAAGSSGIIYVASSAPNASGTYSMNLSKYTSSGTLAWSAIFDVNTAGNVYVGGITLDPSGNILVTGSAYNGTSNKYDLFVVKYNSAGTKLWHQLHNGSANDNDFGSAVVCNTEGTIFIAGGVYQTSLNVNSVILAYKSNGTTLWEETWDNTGLTDVGALLVTSGSNIVVTGLSQVNFNTWEYAALTYQQSTGSLLNSNVTQNGGTQIEKTGDVVADAVGNIYLTGSLGAAGQGFNVQTIKFNTNLQIVWTATWNGISNQDDAGRSIEVDASGNVFVAGYTTTAAGGRDALLLKYTASGSLSFSIVRDGGGGSDEFTDIGLTAQSEILVGGYVTQVSNKDFFAGLYDASGALRWSDTYNGYANGDDEAQQVALDASGNFTLSGTSDQEAAGKSTLSVKYNRHTLVKPQNELVVAPLVENRGQLLGSDGQPAAGVRYYSQQTYPNVYLLDNKVSYVFSHIDTMPNSQDTIVRFDLTFPTNLSGRPNITTGLERQSDFHNYYFNHIPKGRERTPLEAKALMPALYPSIDGLFGQGSEGLFIRFICKPGSAPTQIRLQFEGGGEPIVQTDGSLRIKNLFWAAESLSLPKPSAILIANDGTETLVQGWIPSYSVGSDGKVSITTGSYDATKTLVLRIGKGKDDVPPTAPVWWSTYYGCSNLDMQSSVDTDHNNDDIYTCGRSWSTGFPIGNTTLTPMGQSDWTVNKFNVAGEPKWFTMIGGSGAYDFRERAYDISVGQNTPYLYVGGQAASPWDAEMLPAKVNAYNNIFFGSGTILRAVLLRLGKTAGTVDWGTYFGDSGYLAEAVMGVQALNSGGVAAVGWSHAGTGMSAWQNVNPGGGALQQTFGDMYIGTFNVSDQLTWATKFGPENNAPNDSNYPTDVAKDNNGNLFVTGYIFVDSTQGEGFPSSGGLPFAAGRQGFVAKFSTSRALVWATYIGERCAGVGCDADNNAIVVGTVEESANFPIVGLGNIDLDDASLGGSSDVFLAKFANNGNLLHSRYFGGDGHESTDYFEGYAGNNLTTKSPGNAIAVLPSGDVFITGMATEGLPVTWTGSVPSWYFPVYSGGGGDAFVAAFSPNFRLGYCTYLGSSKKDMGTGIAYLSNTLGAVMVGKTEGVSSNYPTSFETELTYYRSSYLGGQMDGITSKVKINYLLVDAKSPLSRTLELQISPNPCADWLTLQLPEGDDYKGLFCIQDPAGRVVQEVPIMASSQQAVVDVSRLPAGVYFVTFTCPTGIWSGKLLKSPR